MGDTTTHDRLVREVAVGAHAAVVFVNYDRSPEAHYPVAIEEDYAVTKYVAEHPREFNIDAAGLAIAGDSVGGNRVGGMMAAAITCAKSCRTPLGARREPGLQRPQRRMVPAPTSLIPRTPLAPGGGRL